MRRIGASLVMVGGLAPVLQAQDVARGGTPAVRACSLLTKELVSQVSPYDKQALALVLRIAPSEDSLGRSGSACEYGGIHLQIDPFAWATMEKQRENGWVPVADVGDAAYFRDNRGRWAELGVRTGTRVITIQMGVPTGRTVDSIKPNVIALAQAILPKLQ